MSNTNIQQRIPIYAQRRLLKSQKKINEYNKIRQLNNIDIIFLNMILTFTNSKYMLDDICNIILVYQNLRPGCFIGTFQKSKAYFQKFKDQLSVFLNQLQLFFKYTITQRNNQYLFHAFITNKKHLLDFDSKSNSNIGTFLDFPSVIDDLSKQDFSKDRFAASLYLTLMDNQNRILIVQSVAFMIKKQDLSKSVQWLKSFQEKFHKYNKCQFMKHIDLELGSNFITNQQRYIQSRSAFSKQSVKKILTSL